jgi:hypothetical protein
MQARVTSLPFSLHASLYSQLSTRNSLLSALHCLLSTVYTPLSTLYSLLPALCCLRSYLYSVLFLYSLLATRYSTIDTPLSTHYSLRSTPCALLSTTYLYSVLPTPCLYSLLALPSAVYTLHGADHQVMVDLLGIFHHFGITDVNLRTWGESLQRTFRSLNSTGLSMGDLHASGVSGEVQTMVALMQSINAKVDAQSTQIEALSAQILALQADVRNNHRSSPHSVDYNTLSNPPSATSSSKPQQTLPGATTMLHPRFDLSRSTNVEKGKSAPVASLLSDLLRAGVRKADDLGKSHLSFGAKIPGSKTKSSCTIILKSALRGEGGLAFSTVPPMPDEQSPSWGVWLDMVMDVTTRCETEVVRLAQANKDIKYTTSPTKRRPVPNTVAGLVQRLNKGEPTLRAGGSSPSSSSASPSLPVSTQRSPIPLPFHQFHLFHLIHTPSRLRSRLTLFSLRSLLSPAHLLIHRVSDRLTTHTNTRHRPNPPCFRPPHDTHKHTSSSIL